MDIREKVESLMREKGWSMYRLALNSGLSESTIANLIRRNAMPSFPTLEAICRGLGITLSQFFAEGDTVEITPDLKELFDTWRILTPSQKEAALHVIKVIGSTEN